MTSVRPPWLLQLIRCSWLDGRPRRYRVGVIDCAFCAIAAGEKDQPVIAVDEHTVAFLDARRVFKGHALVIPRAHYRTLADLPPELTGLLSRGCGRSAWRCRPWTA